jgi:hypothetical protein
MKTIVSKIKRSIKKPIFYLGPEIDLWLTKLIQIKNRAKAKLGTGGTNDAEYCLLTGAIHYEAYQNVAQERNLPELTTLGTVGEFGCGDTYTTAALFYILGVENVYGIDPYPYVDARLTADNIKEITRLLLQRDYDYINQLNIQHPHHQNSAPNIKVFPHFIKKWKSLNNDSVTLRSEKAIKSVLANEKPVKFVPNFPTEKIDFIFSHAVMEHPDDLEAEYQQLALKTRFQAHAIDCKSHDSSLFALGHYRYSKSQRTRIRSPFPYLRINGFPQNAHKKIWKKEKLTVLKLINNFNPDIAIHTKYVDKNTKLEKDELALSDFYVFLTSQEENRS